jgi:hypothetical protein
VNLQIQKNQEAINDPTHGNMARGERPRLKNRNFQSIATPTQTRMHPHVIIPAMPPIYIGQSYEIQLVSQGLFVSHSARLIGGVTKMYDPAVTDKAPIRHSWNNKSVAVSVMEL